MKGRSSSIIWISSQRSTWPCCAASSKPRRSVECRRVHYCHDSASSRSKHRPSYPRAHSSTEAKSMTVFVQDKDDPNRFQQRNVESAGGRHRPRQRSIRSTPHNARGAVATEGLAAGEKVLARVNADDEAKASKRAGCQDSHGIDARRNDRQARGPSGRAGRRRSAGHAALSGRSRGGPGGLRKGRSMPTIGTR